MQFECRIGNPARSIKQFAPIVVKNVKFRSSPILAGQFTVKIVGQREDDQEDPDISFSSLVRSVVKHFVSSFLNFYYSSL
jgi:hypothetical protein